MPDTDTSVAVREKLRKLISDANLLRDHRPTRYDPGEVLEFEVTGIKRSACAKLQVEAFAGGGFAGQVYRARLTALSPSDADIEGLKVGGCYAVKILKPASRFALLFRNLLYWFAYQSMFAPQVNPAAARSGMLWHKLIRRGARAWFGSEEAVADVYATFYDGRIRSFGEIGEWVDGRHWSFEIDDELFQRRRRKAVSLDSGQELSGSQEYLAKRAFMSRMVKLFHEMGAGELARQYEWWTTKSQPNVLKRIDADEDPAGGLTAVDFRPGLALLPFLPMSPWDFKLIFTGIRRGDWVQFDRGDLGKLEDFVKRNRSDFADLLPVVEELKETEGRYRDSLPDITHHSIRLTEDKALLGSIAKATVENWHFRGLIDTAYVRRFQESPSAFLFFLQIGMIPWLGKHIRRLWGDLSFREHVQRCFSDFSYLCRALRVMRAEVLIGWHRQGRVGDMRAMRLLNRPFRFLLERLLVSWLPAGLHRFLTDASFLWRRIRDTVMHPVRLYFNAAYREEWFKGMLREGREQRLLAPQDEKLMTAQIKEHFMQVYLKSLAVHVCTIPITQIVSLIVAFYAMLKLAMTWKQGLLYAGTIMAVFQVLPVSPGSMVRGGYVLGLMIKERNWRDYIVAAFVSFGHYVGYLGFPLQMVAKYPPIARFMAGSWAMRMVRIVPVFGERGALLEHWVFDTFFNLPLSMKRSWSAFWGRRRPTESAKGV